MRLLKPFLSLVAAAVAAGVVLAAALAPFVGAAGLSVRTTAQYLEELPDTLVEPPLPQGSVLLAADGKTKIATLFLYNRVPVPLEQVAPVMRTALVSIEDSRFYTHPGIDAKGIARALRGNASGGARQGASTLTQQYVKNTLLLAAQTADDEEAAKAATAVSLQRKLKEAKLALVVDSTHTKDEILAGYLNISYFGAGAYGIQAASLRYFSTPAAKLTLRQAALLAGLVQSPNALNPLEHPQAATARRNTVLARMLALGKITQAQHDKAASSKLGLKPSQPTQGCAASAVPFFCDHVRATLENDPSMGATPTARRARLLQGGLRITTTIDLPTQAAAQKALARTIPDSHRVAASAVLIQPGTGHVTAMVVNRAWGTGSGKSELPLMTAPAYQPGSTFKIFTLAAALEQGMPLSTRLPGGDHYTSRVFDNPAGGGFSNAADGHGTNLTLRSAMAESVNTAFVQLQERTGTKAVADAAVRAGITSLRNPTRPVSEREGSLTLGARETSPLQVANAYATFAAHGRACPPVVVTAIRDTTGARLPSPSTTCTQVFDPAVADTVTDVMRSVMTTGGTGTDAALPGRPAAGKTGTTDNQSAAWFAGYTPQLATAVVLADPRGAQQHPLHDVLGVSRVYGGTLPAKIFRDVMTAALNGQPALKLPRPDAGYLLGANPTTVTVPDLAGLSRDDAAARLRQVGLRATVTESATRLPVPHGVVMSTQPAAGSAVAPGAKVRLELTAD